MCWHPSLFIYFTVLMNFSSQYCVITLCDYVASKSQFDEKSNRGDTIAGARAGWCMYVCVCVGGDVSIHT